MAKVIIEITGKGSGFRVRCKTDCNDDDNARVKAVAHYLSRGLIGYVFIKLRKSIYKPVRRTVKVKSNVH